MRVLPHLLALLPLAGCAAQVSSRSTQVASTAAGAAPIQAPIAATLPPTAPEGLGKKAAQAVQLFQDRQFAQADAQLTSIIADPEFSALPSAQQHAVLTLGATMALQMHDPPRGLMLLQRACNMSEATAFDWVTRVRAADAAGDERDMTEALTVLAVRWPDALTALERSGDLDYAMRSLEKLGSDADRLAVLSALFGVHLSRQHDEESGWWRDLALFQLASGNRVTAAGTLQRVSNAYVTISVEADRRFDPIRGLLDTWPSAAKTAAQAIARASRRAQDDPGELEPMTRLAGLLGNSLRFSEELQVTDVAIERVDAAGPQAYSDYAREYTWILNKRADALYGLGRWEAALIQLQTASELPEDGAPNVSQLINLAGMYAEMEKPVQSQAALEQAHSRAVTPFGDMQRKLVAIFAATQLHDAKTANETLALMRQHRADAPGALQEALLVAGHDDEGAQLLISRLHDLRLRSDALVAVQRYEAGLLPRWLVEKHHRWRTLVARRDVQAALDQVGRVAQYPLDRPGY